MRVSPIRQQAGFDRVGFLRTNLSRPAERVVAFYNRRYRDAVSWIHFRAVAAFADPEVYEYLEAGGTKYAIRLPANRVLQERIRHPMPSTVGHPPNHVRRYHASFSYQAATWSKPRRVVAKV
jgi:hypothetical protein